MTIYLHVSSSLLWLQSIHKSVVVYQVAAAFFQPFFRQKISRLNLQPIQQQWPAPPAAVKSVSRPAVDWLTAGLIFDEGRGMNQRPVSQIVWCRKHPNLCYCYPSLSCAAIHRARGRVLHSLRDSFTQDRSTMKSEKQWLLCPSHLYHLSSSISGLQADRWRRYPPSNSSQIGF